MLIFKKLALIAIEIQSKTSGETATEPKTIPPAVFQKWAGGNKCVMDDKYGKEEEEKGVVRQKSERHVGKQNRC